MDGDALSVVPPKAAPTSGEVLLTRTSVAALCSHSSYICRDMSKASYFFFTRGFLRDLIKKFRRAGGL